MRYVPVSVAVTDISVLGHLDNGTEYLAAASLAFVWMDITIALPASASDSLNQLCAQAYGANNLSLVGRWLQVLKQILHHRCHVDCLRAPADRS